MRKSVYGYRLSRNSNQRKALFKGLMNALIMREGIETTITKAKAIKGPFEKLVTKAKDNTITARRTLIAKLGMENTAAKMVELIGPRFKDRSGGYTRIIKIGPRHGDNALMVRLEFVEEIKPVETKAVKKVESSQSPKIKVTRKTVVKKEKPEPKKEDKSA
ncbi:MAG: 50S ribosomal protein L17 [Candidatus Woykebacteria bacterium RIFCSPHIGHO2_12_FULL_43_10]|uniref:50S ribosomal protein L17 n=2 Tax=Candidatus Woykeibacteriota TaxID=1817899 RepID=A0A1G1WYR5_9BACT|nr:MAG: 50S ribosomal protein L17 [Candidatus Woykebacteria bacterium RIFCSPHIGHO2_01_FULL_43_29]OGY28720.1 MAG: 50S ribosomal protein L17 [Candidatus Woykebacteria bacterium RIFCSPHIGHO2_02_FULL_43_16b]OGY29796.1 MAG: 50S ribosomal protein L17 [Candidatus Woykebacteria bacterium RIFCSPHIGHO2_12_FULL_43_10]OGY32470.1 MAG: 50S ribosomal protein L17 [Candidatus Woykebacteria bacterium RIFCSPLOWO2_01_FULL_43_14]